MKRVGLASLAYLALSTSAHAQTLDLGSLLPSGGAVSDVVRTYLSALFAEDVPTMDLQAVAARRTGGLLEIDLPPRVDRLCDEDVLVPVVAQLAVRTVRLNRLAAKAA